LSKQRSEADVLRIGLTGSIATGKTTVLNHIASQGIPVFSSDEAVHRLYAGAAAAPIERLFPGVTDKGVVDREKLSAELLAHPERLTELEALVHPMVRNEVAYFFKAEEGRGAKLAVVDVPLLFERGFDYGLDAIIVTAVDEATQRERAMARPGMTVEKLTAILARQMPQAEKKARADYVIDTSGSIESTQGAITALLERLKADPRAA
jgi:dephospho-CoA kinase